MPQVCSVAAMVLPSGAFTASSSSRNVDVVNTNAGTADYFQIGGSVDNFLCYLCLAACYQAVVFADAFQQFFWRHIGFYVHIKMFPQ